MYGSMGSHGVMDRSEDYFQWPKSVRDWFPKGWLVGAGMGGVPVLQVVRYMYCLSALVHNMMWHSCLSTLVYSTMAMIPFSQLETT